MLLSMYLISLAYGRFDLSTDPSQVKHNIIDTLSDHLVNRTRLEVRTGYFSLCVKGADGLWKCRRNATILAKDLHPDQDPLNLVWQSQKFRDSVVFSPLLLVSCITASYIWARPNAVARNS